MVNSDGSATIFGEASGPLRSSAAWKMVCSRDEADFRALPVQAPPRGPGRLGQGYATPLKSWRRFNDLEVRTKVAIRYGARSDEPGFHPERALLPGRRGRMENVQTAAAHFRRLVGGNKLHKGPRLGPAGPCETLAQACRHRRFGELGHDGGVLRPERRRGAPLAPRAPGDGGRQGQGFPAPLRGVLPLQRGGPTSSTR